MAISEILLYHQLYHFALVGYRMQRVIALVRNTLNDLKLAIDGTIIMSEMLRDALDSMYDAQIPKAWLKVRRSN